MSDVWMNRSWPAELSSEEATKIIAEAIAELGRPTWASVVPSRIRKMVPVSVLAQLLEGAQPVFIKRADKYQYIIDWCMEHVGEKVSPKQLGELHGISYPTALKFVSDRPDVFWKSGRGTYEIRDPQKDRQNNL